MNGAKTARYPEHHELAELFKFQDVTLKLCSLSRTAAVNRSSFSTVRNKAQGLTPSYGQGSNNLQKC